MKRPTPGKSCREEKKAEGEEEKAAVGEERSQAKIPRLGTSCREEEEVETQLRI